MSAFFKLVDRRLHRTGCMIRLSEIIAVNDPTSSSDPREWACTVVVRSGECYSIGGDMDTVYKERDKLLHALEQDAMPLIHKAMMRRRDEDAEHRTGAAPVPFPRD